MIKNVMIVGDYELDFLKPVISEQKNLNAIFVSYEEVTEVLKQDCSFISAIVMYTSVYNLDELEMIKNIRLQNEYANIPIMLISDEVSIEYKKMVVDYGVNRLITKPYDADLVLDSIVGIITSFENTALAAELSEDRLTGLISHGIFFRKCNELINSHEPGHYVMSCVDIDNFKVINDQYGMEVGDKVIKYLADCVNDCVDKLGGLVCRFNADRFAIMYPAMFTQTAVIRNNHTKATTPPFINHPIRIHIGRYCIEDLSLDSKIYYERATVAEESIKDRYDIYVAEYNDSMRDRIIYEQRIVNEMKDALNSGEFIPFFQPQYNHATGALIGAEALVRWKKDGEFIQPGDFISIFEKNGFIYEIDKYIWERICILLRRWLDEKRNVLPVSVNVSRIDIYRDDFYSMITGLVEKYKIPVDLLRIEVTESAFSETQEHIVNMVNRLIKYGFTIEIDDFGSGYSSLNTLKDVPAQILKLDMKFFSDTENATRSGNIIESVVRMAKWLSMAVIAEGVEKVEQADFLKSIGCYYIQGYLYSRPIPAEEYERLLLGSSYERKLTRLKTISTLDNGDFWNPESMETLIFNSYIGGACILEQYCGKSELIRINDTYIRELGSVVPDHADFTDFNPIIYMDSDNLFQFNHTITEAVSTKNEASCEIRIENDEHSIEYIRLTVRLIATTHERNLIYCIISNITKQRQTEHKLIMTEKKESENSQRLKVVMDNINGGVSAIIINEDATSEMVFCNEKYYYLYGYSKEQILDNSFDVMTRIVPEDIDSVMVKVRKLKRDRIPTHIDYRITKPDGTYALLRATCSIMSIEEYGDDVITSVITDITVKKSLEDQLQAIITNINGGVSAAVIEDDNIEFILVNEQFYNILGYETSDQFENEGKDKYYGLHPDDRDRVIKIYMTNDGDKKQYDIDYRIIRRDGEIRYIHNNVSTVSLFGIEEPVRLSVINDNTDLHIAQIKERALTKQLNIILENVNGGVSASVVHDINSVELIYRNKGFYDMYGYTSQQMEAEVPNIFELIVPEDRDRIMNTIEKVICNHERKTYEYRCIKRDGSIMWTQVTNAVISMEGVGSSILLAIHTDITEQMDRINRQKRLLDNLPLGVALYEYDGENVSVRHINKKYWELVNRYEKDYTNSSIFEVVHPSDRDGIFAELNSAILHHRSAIANVRILCGNNEYKPFHITVNIMKEKTGNYLLFTAYELISE